MRYVLKVTGASTRRASTEPPGELAPPAIAVVVGGDLEKGRSEELGEGRDDNSERTKTRGERGEFIKYAQRLLLFGLAPRFPLTGGENSQQSSPL